MKSVASALQTMESRTQKTDREHVGVFGRDGDIKVVEKGVKFGERFHFMFGENMDKVLIAHPLGATAFRVLFRVLALVSRGDVVAVSQTGVASDLGISRQAVNKAWKDLRAAGILLLDQAGHEYINVNLFHQGSPKDLVRGEGKDRLDQSVLALEDTGARKVVK